MKLPSLGSILRAITRFFGVPAIDLKHYPINMHFAEAADFIDSVIRGKGLYSCNEWHKLPSFMNHD